MNIEITRSKVHGNVMAPPSKSLSHRAIIIAALASGTSTLTNVLEADDIEQTIQGLRALGVTIEKAKKTIRIIGGKLRAPKNSVHLGQSGSSLRLLTAVAGLTRGTTILTGDKRLCERPMKDLIISLQKLGISIRSMKNNGCAPIEVIGGTIKGGEIHVDGSQSSQFISGLLLIAPFAQNKTTIHVLNGHSMPYIELTLKVMRDFGVEVMSSEDTFIIAPKQEYKPRTYEIEGDYSSSSYLFAVAAVTGSAVTVRNLNPRSFQGDKHFLALLSQMGCSVTSNESETTLVPAKKLHSITTDLGNYPDIVQSLAVVAAVAQGTTNITNVEHLKHKETDRLRVTSLELNKMGIDATSSTNSLTITGGSPKGTEISSHSDHRMAMSFAVLGLASTGKTVVRDAEVVNKSYPNFFDDLLSLGAHIKETL